MIKTILKAVIAVMMISQVAFAGTRPDARSKSVKEVREALVKARENTSNIGDLVTASKLTRKEVQALLKIDSDIRLNEMVFTREFRDSFVEELKQAGVVVRSSEFYKDMADGIKSVSDQNSEKTSIVVETFREALENLSETSGDSSKLKESKDLALTVRLLSVQGKDFVKESGEGTSFFRFVEVLRENKYDLVAAAKIYLKETGKEMTVEEFLAELRKRCLG